MSEYQYVEFRAIDAPLTDEQLDFADEQSSRAEISRWSFSVEYHYSSFRGDVDEMLRQGYDVYLEYTNYGSRIIKLRLPQGMPVDESLRSQYTDGERLVWVPDETGPGGILSLEPYLEEVWENFWDFDTCLDAATVIRDHLIRGDLRALYLLWLCAANWSYSEDEENIEPLVPHGIAEMVSKGGELLPFFLVDPLMLMAAGDGVPSAPAVSPQNDAQAKWLKKLSAADAKTLLTEFLIDDATSVKAKLLAEIRNAHPTATWPVTEHGRTFEELEEQTESLRAAEKHKEALKAKAKAEQEAARIAQERAERMQKMVDNPEVWLKKAEQLVEARGTANYKEASEILQELRESLSSEDGDRMVNELVEHLVTEYPRLNMLKSELRKHELWGA